MSKNITLKQISCIIIAYFILGIGLGMNMPIPHEYRPFTIFTVPIAILLIIFSKIFKQEVEK